MMDDWTIARALMLGPIPKFPSGVWSAHLNPHCVLVFPPVHWAAADLAEEARRGAIVSYVKGASTVVAASQEEK